MDASTWGPLVGTVIGIGLPALIIGGRMLQRERQRARTPGTLGFAEAYDAVRVAESLSVQERKAASGSLHGQRVRWRGSFHEVSHLPRSNSAYARFNVARPGFDIELHFLVELQSATQKWLDTVPPGHLLEVDGTLMLDSGVPVLVLADPVFRDPSA